MYYPKPVNASYTDSNNLMPWPEHMDPDVSQPIEEETKTEEADVNEEDDELVDASKERMSPRVKCLHQPQHGQMHELNEINFISIEGHDSEIEKECDLVGAATRSAF
eukprot:11159787-Ditylum_brightwellii.AAC.1